MESKPATRKQLQQRCSELGLDRSGNKDMLLERIREHTKNAAPSVSHDEEPSTESDTECDAVLATKIDIGGEEEMRQSGKDALQQELVTRELEFEVAGGKLMVGNRRGLSLAGRLAVLETTVVKLKMKNALQDTRIAAQDTRNASLEGQVAGLTVSVEAYKSVRNRFISTYKRDVLENDTDVDRRIIASGNASGHGGDAVADALLYKQGARSDYSVYKKLYGINPTTVELISEPRTFALLNMHAGVVASKYKRGSETFYAKFREFVRCLEDSDYDEDYSGEKAVTRAYWAFHLCAQTDVTKVGNVAAEV